MRITPWTLSPNPAWMYLTPSTLASIERIKWMVDERQGLAVIFGDVGTGKSTILRSLAADYADEQVYRTAFLTRVDFRTAYAFAVRLSSDFGVPAKRSLAAQNEALEDFLTQQYEAERQVVVFLDEAQALTAELLDVIRGLLNFESNFHKLIQIVLAGQLDLLDRIRAKRNKPLASRIFQPVMLHPLSPEDTAAMIDFRCKQAHVPNPFTGGAVDQIFNHSAGVPRAILLLCAHAAKAFPAPIQPEHIEAVVQRGVLVAAAS